MSKSDATPRGVFDSVKEDVETSVPVLLKASDDDGFAGRLNLRLIRDNTPVLYPDPMALGWTALLRDSDRRNKDGFHNSFQRTWSRLPEFRPYDHRVRWGLGAFQAKQRFNVCLLTGRSLEAALACALRAAMDPDDEPDNATAVSARLDFDNATATTWQNIPLDTVDGVLLKLEAARTAGIDTVIFALNQRLPGVNDVDGGRGTDPFDQTWIWDGTQVTCEEDSGQGNSGRFVRIYRLPTLGDAYDLLCRPHRLLTALHDWHQQQFWDEFSGDWHGETVEQASETTT